MFHVLHEEVNLGGYEIVWGAAPHWLRLCGLWLVFSRTLRHRSSLHCSRDSHGNEQPCLSLRPHLSCGPVGILRVVTGSTILHYGVVWGLWVRVQVPFFFSVLCGGFGSKFTLTARAAHALPLRPAALVSVPYGFVLD
jgi:hypothetical protein